MLALRQPELQYSCHKGRKKAVTCSKGRGGVEEGMVALWSSKAFAPQLVSVNPVELVTKQDTRWCKSIRACHYGGETLNYLYLFCEDKSRQFNLEEI